MRRPALVIAALLAACATTPAPAPPPAKPAAPRVPYAEFPAGWIPDTDAKPGGSFAGAVLNPKHDAKIRIFLTEASSGSPRDAVAVFRQKLESRGAVIGGAEEDGAAGFCWSGRAADGHERSGCVMAWRLNEDPSVIVTLSGEWPSGHMEAMLDHFQIIAGAVTLK